MRLNIETHSWPLDRHEATFLAALQRALPWKWTISFARGLSFIAEHAAAWLVISVIVWIIDVPQRRAWFFLALGVLVAHLASSCIKFVVRRSRPTDPRVQRVGHTMSMLSFPSSHSANTAAFATGVTVLYPAMLLPGILLVLIMGVVRMRLGVHYPSDILAGIALGTGIALLASHFG